MFHQLLYLLTFLFALPVLILALYIFVFHPRDPPVSQKLDISLLATGDLLFFPGNSFIENGIKTFQNAPYTHVGMVVRGRKNAYLVEVDRDLDKSNVSGVQMVDLSRKLFLSRARRRNKYIEWHRFHGTAPRYADVKKIVDEHKHLDTDYSFVYGLVSNIIERQNNEVFCSEFIVMLLEKCGLVTLTRAPAWYMPQAIRQGTGMIPRDVYTYWENKGTYLL